MEAKEEIVSALPPQRDVSQQATQTTKSSDSVSPPQRFSTLRLIIEDIRAWHRLWYQSHWKDASNPPRLRRHWRECLGLVWAYSGLRATIMFRIGYGLKRRHVFILPHIIGTWNLILHGLDIPPYIDIGPGLYVPHPVGTVITAKQIGANVTLVSGITIGMRGEGGFPIIGDNVYIGAGARILGGIVVGDGASIGANAVVLKDVPPGATAVGVPAVIKFPARARETAPQGTGSPT